MRAVHFGGERRIEVSERAEPRPAAGEVLLRVQRTALCGSDLKLWQRGCEQVPGHEIFGVVDQPDHPMHGQRACVYIPVHCGRCDSCRRGDTHLCLAESTLVGWNRDGGYAEALAVPEQCLLPVPDDIDDDLAPLLLDTIGTAAHGLRTVRAWVPPPQAEVLILGAGPVGLGGLLAAQELGYRRIFVADPRPARLALAVSLGAEPHPVGELSRRFALIVESSGAHAARNQALAIVAPRGAVLLIGENDAPWTIEETRAIRRKDFAMLRSFYFPKTDLAGNIELLRRRRADYRRFVDARCDLDGFAPMFTRFAAGELLKPLLMSTSQPMITA
jgi:threonine dehydrogenase-like Zn-dependent dehydrogenase